MRSALSDGRSSQPAVASQPDTARQMHAKRLQQWTQCQRFLLPRWGRAARSKARREQTIWADAPPTDSRDEPGSIVPSVPLPPTHNPGHGTPMKKKGFSSFAFRTHALVAMDVCFFTGTRGSAFGRAGSPLHAALGSPMARRECRALPAHDP